MRTGPKLGPKLGSVNPGATGANRPRPAGRYLGRICPVGSFFTVPRNLAGGFPAPLLRLRRDGKVHSAMTQPMRSHKGALCNAPSGHRRHGVAPLLTTTPSTGQRVGGRRKDARRGVARGKVVGHADGGLTEGFPFAGTCRPREEDGQGVAPAPVWLSLPCAGWLEWHSGVWIALRVGRDGAPRQGSLRIFSDKAGPGAVKRHDGGPQVTV